MPAASFLRNAPAPYVVPYLLVDRRRRAQLVPRAHALAEGGAAAVELGFPFSDPIADGPVLEGASGRALAAGTDWGDLLDAVRATAAILPTAVMTYANPVWHRGLREACGELAGAGARGLIVPDLSLEESGPWRAAASAADLQLVLLAAPGGSVRRVRDIAERSHGFLYLVSRYGTTGAGPEPAGGELRPLVRAAQEQRPDLPVLIGFGVRDARSARSALRTGADGVIVGTALEERLAQGADPASLRRWVRSVAHAG